MSDDKPNFVPGWQTEELQDEWPDMEEEEEEEGADRDEDDRHSYGTQSVSFTAPLSTHIHTNTDFEHDSPASGSRAVGTFLVREDVPDVPLHPKTPGRNKKAVKDIFTPLALERMFDPPTPPFPTQTQPEPHSQTQYATPSIRSAARQSQTSAMQDEIIETDIPNMNSFHGRRAAVSCQFTFSMPRETTPTLSPPPSSLPQAQSTPNPPVPLKNAPVTDPRLRLFQFQYDTYTREHLSALVDSIAVNTPSGTGTGTTSTPTNFTNGLSRVSEVTGTAANVSHMRSAKRIKLSPSSDVSSEDAGSNATISRPKIFGKDYVGESRSLMEKIKQAKDYSTISTVASAEQSPSTTSNRFAHISASLSKTPKHNATPSSNRRPSFLSVPEQTSSPSTSPTMSSGASYSSSSYRQKAAALMEQIKSDVKRQKRVFSGDSDTSQLTSHVDDSTNTTTRSYASVRSNGDGKENSLRSNGSLRQSSTSRSHMSKGRHSPRKTSRNVVDDLTQDLSRTSLKDHTPLANGAPIINVTHAPPNPPTLPVDRPSLQSSTTGLPNYPSIRITNSDDLNRFVSSSTASGTTITAGSAPSFSKHAGPPHLRTIAPADIPTMPDRVGDMMFDKTMMKWVKNTQRAMDQEKSMAVLSEGSEDPFGDIESLRDESRSNASRHSRQSSSSLSTGTVEEHEDEEDAEAEEEDEAPHEMTRISEHPEDEEEVELMSFSTDASAHVVAVMTGVETDVYEEGTTDSEEDEDLRTVTRPAVIHDGFDSDFEDVTHPEISPETVPSGSGLAMLGAAPSGPRITTPSRGNLSVVATPSLKSALKSASATPTSAARAVNQTKYETPLHRKPHRRSVSFSDGKRDGPIEGITASGGTVHSIRSKRIADMMNALEDSDLDEDDSPSKASTTSARPEELQPLAARHPSSGTGGSTSSMESPRRVFSRTYSQRASPGKGFARANGTFLTECSFGVAHDRLVQVITDVRPFEPHWEELSSIDLSDAKLESVARLKEFLPRLDTLSLNHNQLAWLSGIPGSVRTLSVASNCLTGLTSYSHLHNLESLDISDNEVDSLRQLECLRHLRELKADGNKLTNVDGLEKMSSLAKLSLQNNAIQSIDFALYQWGRLEMLNISHNRLSRVAHLENAPSLIALNLDNNALQELKARGTMGRMRVLRVSGNRLKDLNVAPFPSLRTLYADNNALCTLVKVDRLTKLENLSLRNQSGGGFKLLTREVRDVKRLYLSGNPLRAEFLQEPCYNLIYLEVAACRLTALPEGLSQLVPNLRVLNLNYNFLEDVRALEGLTRMRKLTIIGSRLQNTKPLIRLVQKMPDLEMVDFRMNPCTLGWYLPLLVRDVPGALQPSEGAVGSSGRRWQELDSKFRRDLPDSAYIGRLAYRGLIMRACAGIVLVDGVGVSEKEREKAGRLLDGLAG